VQRGVDALVGLCASLSKKTDSLVIGFIGDEVVVNAERLPKSAAALVGFARDMREREIEKITIHRGVTREDLRTVHLRAARAQGDAAAGDAAAAERGQPHRPRAPLAREGGRGPGDGIVAARKIYGTAVETAEQLWLAAKSGRSRTRARRARSSTAWRSWSAGDRTSLLALTALKRYDNYTFTHMVNVSVLAMAQARSLNMEGRCCASSASRR
jgi:HD-GYP domain-containing protein (c-di-GMP phosphodiesterase class II)